MDVMNGHLLAQSLMGGIILGHHQQTTGVLVDAMNNAGADGAADTGQTACAVIQKRVDQGTVRIAGGRMHHHPFRFVDDQKMVILEHNIQRNVLGLGFDGLRVRQRYQNGIPCHHFVFLVHRLTIAQYSSLFHQRLQGTAGKLPAAAGKPAVHPLAGILRRGDKLKRLHRSVHSERGLPQRFGVPDASPAAAKEPAVPRRCRHKYRQN